MRRWLEKNGRQALLVRKHPYVGCYEDAWVSPVKPTVESNTDYRVKAAVKVI